MKARLCVAWLLPAAVALLGSHVALANPQFSPKAPTTKYADWFQAASHNTYYNEFNGSTDWTKFLDYTKAIEFDVWPAQAWRVHHNTREESYCAGPLNKCLMKVRDWHDQHRDHDPITIFLEIKGLDKVAGFRVWDLNGMLCGPTRGSKANGRDASGDDAVFACNELYRPIDLIEPSHEGRLRRRYNSLREAAQAGAWPNLATLKNKIIFVINSSDRTVPQQYLQEARLTSVPNDDRGDANAFVMMTAKTESDINNVPGQLSSKPDLARHIVFYNGECRDWNADLGRLIRLNNYLSRGYYCEKNITNNAATFESTWIGTNMINFVSYDNLEEAYGVTKPGATAVRLLWNGGSPQGDFQGGRWTVTPNVILNAPGLTLQQITPDIKIGEALRIAESNPRINFFLYLQQAGSCPNGLPGGPSYAKYTACFYSGTPSTVPQPGAANLYIKK